MVFYVFFIVHQTGTKPQWITVSPVQGWLAHSKEHPSFWILRLPALPRTFTQGDSIQHTRSDFFRSREVSFRTFSNTCCRMNSAQDADIRLFCAGDMVAFAGEHPLVLFRQALFAISIPTLSKVLACDWAKDDSAAMMVVLAGTVRCGAQTPLWMWTLWGHLRSHTGQCHRMSSPALDPRCEQPQTLFFVELHRLALRLCFIDFIMADL